MDVEAPPAPCTCCDDWAVKFCWPAIVAIPKEMKRKRNVLQRQHSHQLDLSGNTELRSGSPAKLSYGSDDLILDRKPPVRLLEIISTLHDRRQLGLNLLLPAMVHFRTCIPPPVVVVVVMMLCLCRWGGGIHASVLFGIDIGGREALLEVPLGELGVRCRCVHDSCFERR